MAYTGITAPIPLGQFGLNTDNAVSELPPGSLIEAKNITLIEGVVQKAPGSLIWNPDDQLDGGIMSVHDWWPETHLQRTIALTNAGKLYRDIGDRTFTSATPIATDLGVVNPNSKFIEGGNEDANNPKKLFLFTDGLRQLKVLTGDATTLRDINAPAADWVTPKFPIIGVAHRARLWAFMGQRAYASDTGDHENFTSNNLTQPIFPGEGGDILGAHVYKGRLFSFKAGGFVYYLDDSAADSSTWFWKKLTDNFGLAAPNAAFNGLDDMIAGNSSGTATSYIATQKLGDIESADVFRSANMENYLRDFFSTSGVRVMHALYYEDKKQAFFTYRSTYKNENDMLLVLDVNKDYPRVTTWIKGTPMCLAHRRDINGIKRPMYGSNDGYVHFMDYEDRKEGSAAYEGAFKTAYTDFRHMDPKLMSMQKNFDFIWLEFGEEGSHSVSIDVFIDGKFIETINIPMTAQEIYLNQFTLNTDRFNERTNESIPYKIHGTGRRISFRVYNSGSNESFRIASITVGFRPGSEDAAKF